MIFIAEFQIVKSHNINQFARLREEQIPERKLESVKLLLMFKSAQGRDENWSVAMSEKYGKAMYNILFPRELA